ncbi:bifunctional phosphopantothenoylcysteine decarboxylase/phosphopantothenate--cysteine ligase CoaBC [Sulfurimonas sp. SAG-AH-194-C21]|nr:bifunctional phosphopantothenoylcysteine decarboxylase/phosphopantothenate--cysteine ligase CoaBC [Sulfurimonas sp. SAG-AH-194-C21]MDF1884082.1 bifunctional phosphopantothenoylcysteine decarboxylase/phosphopantothenate--cysteine ligase CoaBC [Sulfurimonas sp. SAG-AH-194-C21]
MNIPDTLLQNKKILLGVTGSIACYKSLELVRLFVKAGAEVKVVMSESAKKFVTPLTFETLTSNRVLDDTNESWVDSFNHIKTTEWADIFVIAPVTANTMAKLSHGIADTMLLQCALAFSGQKVLAPSANTNMIHNPITLENIKILKNSNYTFVDTQIKELACKTVGDGAMAEPINIFWATAKELLKDEFWSDRDAIVTGGGTIEKIDDVRFISNFSSGKMASAMATALYTKGANVKLISTKFDTDLPTGINIIKVQATQEMYESVVNAAAQSKSDANKKPYLFMAAAVSDYVPDDKQSGKLKKDSIGDEWELKLTKNIDILFNIKKENLCVIGFKAEMDKNSAKENAVKMLKNKNLDAVCLNVLKDSNSFGTDTNKVEFITKDSSILIPSAQKLNIAFNILENAKSI